MKARIALAIVLLTLPFTAMGQSAGKTGKSRQPSAASVRQLHESAIVVDTHADTTQFFLAPEFDFEKGEPWVHVTLDKAKAGGLDAEFFSIWGDETYKGPAAVEFALKLIDGVHQTVKRHPDRMVLATTVDEIKRNANRGKLVALMGVEGGHLINNSLEVLRDFHRLGVRYMTLTWANSTDWADSSGDTAPTAGTWTGQSTQTELKPQRGLTEFGREVVAEMNRLGMMIDISHVSDRTFFDVMAATKAPVIASHSSARAVASHPRNMTDDMLRAMAKNGGVVMVNFFSMFVDDDFARQYRATAKERDAEVAKVREELKDDPVKAYTMGHRKGQELAAAVPRPPFERLMAHFDHIIKVAGVDHVGLGSDFDGVSSMPSEMDSAADLPKITAALLARGYSPADVKKILGGNILRVMAENERVARELQKPSKGKAAAAK